MTMHNSAFGVFISPGGGVLFKTKDERRKTGRLRPPHSAETARKNPPTPPPSSGNWSCRHFCPKTYAGRDFYPSIFRVFCTLFEAFLLYLCQCTWPHKIPIFSRGPLIFAPARHQSATQTAPKPVPKLRVFSCALYFRFRSAPKRTADRAYTARFFAHPCVDVLSLPPPVCRLMCVNAPQTAPKLGPKLRAFSPARA